jgi:hypothetical protein
VTRNGSKGDEDVAMDAGVSSRLLVSSRNENCGCDEDVAMDAGVSSRPGGGVVVSTNAFDMGAEAWGGCVVESEGEGCIGRKDGDDMRQQEIGELVGSASKGFDGVVEGLEVGACGGVEPGGEGVPANANQGPQEKPAEPPAVARVQES